MFAGVVPLDCQDSCSWFAHVVDGVVQRAEANGGVLGIGQDSVSRLEQQSDLLISTLRGYVEAMGGRLSLIAELPNQTWSSWPDLQPLSRRKPIG